MTGRHALPIYEYACESCNKQTERLQKIFDPPLAKCPDCGGRVRKLISSAGLHFKGSGWYVTDYAKKKGNGESSSKSASSTAKASQKKESSATPAKSKD